MWVTQSWRPDVSTFHHVRVRYCVCLDVSLRSGPNSSGPTSGVWDNSSTIHYDPSSGRGESRRRWRTNFIPANLLWSLRV